MPTKASNLRLLLLTLIIAAYAVQEARTRQQKVYHSYPSQRELPAQINRRVMIGSTAPRCTYDECRGCRYKCRAEQVPVEGNDPMNSAYHYRCVCHK